MILWPWPTPRRSRACRRGRDRARTGSQSRPHSVAVKKYNIMQQAAATRLSFPESQGSSLEPRDGHSNATQTVPPCYRALGRWQNVGTAWAWGDATVATIATITFNLICFREEYLIWFSGFPLLNIKKLGRSWWHGGITPCPCGAEVVSPCHRALGRWHVDAPQKAAWRPLGVGTFVGTTRRDTRIQLRGSRPRIHQLRQLKA